MPDHRLKRTRDAYLEEWTPCTDAQAYWDELVKQSAAKERFSDDVNPAARERADLCLNCGKPLTLPHFDCASYVIVRPSEKTRLY